MHSNLLDIHLSHSEPIISTLTHSHGNLERERRKKNFLIWFFLGGTGFLCVALAILELTL